MDLVILAADDLDLNTALRYATVLGPKLYAIKIHSLYDEQGPMVVRQLKNAGAQRVWVDAKLHDIPNTVKLRAAKLAHAGADIISVHAEGGIEMMQAALESRAYIYAITVLTSLSEVQVKDFTGRAVIDAVCHRAHLAKVAGVHGVVCAPPDVAHLRADPEFRLLEIITPGIRSAGKDRADQKRVDTPIAALAAGATRLVIGRQLTQALDPYAVYAELEKEIALPSSIVNKLV